MELRLQNVVIPARKFHDSVSFYRDVLGLGVLNEGSDYCFLRAGSANIVVHKDNGEHSPTGRGIYLDLLVDDLSAVRKSLEEASISIMREWEDRNGQFLLVSDPEGNLLEIYKPSG
jgi:catechol-2,3-dioxygenase